MAGLSRRSLMATAGMSAAALGLGAIPAAEAEGRSDRRVFVPPGGPRVRVVSDNDYSGDPDGLFQLVHHMLSPSVDMRTIIGSHLAPGDPFDPSTETATHAAERARTVLRLSGLGRRVPVQAGSNVALAAPHRPRRSAGAKAIVAEAMRTDSALPLFVTLGAGLTELASAYLIEPRIADRLTAVWIGGPEYPGLAVPPPGASGIEYNLNIDLVAAQVIFNRSTIPIWQVPRDAYRQALVSMTELLRRVRGAGAIGEYMYNQVVNIYKLAAPVGLNLGETYILGDSPLVLLTALQSSFQADPSSSAFVTRSAPTINNDGSYSHNAHGRPIRVYTHIDTRLLFEDLYDKLAVNYGRA